MVVVAPGEVERYFCFGGTRGRGGTRGMPPLRSFSNTVLSSRVILKKVEIGFGAVFCVDYGCEFASTALYSAKRDEFEINVEQDNRIKKAVLTSLCQILLSPRAPVTSHESATK